MTNDDLTDGNAWPKFRAPPMHKNPAPGWEDPELPDFEKIWHAARKNGWVVALHGSMRRDCDLVAVPWIDGASNAFSLVEDICKAINARQIGETEIKPHGRIAMTLQIDGWFKPIDLSIFQC